VETGDASDAPAPAREPPLVSKEYAARPVEFLLL
jgi:hypothetical protein